jgi:hypothetical protein
MRLEPVAGVGDDGLERARLLEGSAGLDVDLLLGLLRLGAFGQRHRQHALGEVRLDPVEIDADGMRKERWNAP